MPYTAEKRVVTDAIYSAQSEDPSSELELALYHLDQNGHNPDELRRLLEGLAKNKPIARIIGYIMVHGAKIMINDDVLHPGPETQALTWEVINHVRRSNAIDVLDMCCGSGAIGISVANNCRVQVTACDISEAALNVARANAVLNGVSVDFLKGDLFAPLEDRALFDVIVANPPYVRTDELDIQPDFVRDYAPKLSIDGGEDGLMVHRRIIETASQYMRPMGVMFLECNDGQDKAISRLAKATGWMIVECYLNRHSEVRSMCLKARLES